MPHELRALVDDARVTVRRGGAPDADGECVVYWMQRAERGRDNHAVDVAVRVANALELPLVVYFAGIANFPGANLRHYAFLNRGLVDVEEDLAERNISFVLRNAPHESHERFFADVKAAFVVGDENPMREPERWRREIAAKIKVPFWTVDADVVVPSKLIEKAQYGAYTIRPTTVPDAAGVRCAVCEPEGREGVEAAEGTTCGRRARGHDSRLEAPGPDGAAGGCVDGRTPCGDAAAEALLRQAAGDV